MRAIIALAGRPVGVPARAAAAVVVGLACCFVALPSEAAVRHCYPRLVATAEHPQSEIEARRRALADWLAAAGKLGPGYTRWQLAQDRRISCERTAAGGHRCRASAGPCTISNNPAKPPPPPPFMKRGKSIEA